MTRSQAAKHGGAPTPQATRPPVSSRGVSRHVGARPITIGKPNDRYEQEADRVADFVMRSAAIHAPSTQAPANNAQRVCESCAQDEELLQPSPTSASPSAGTAPPSVTDTLAHSGQPLSGETQAFFAPRFGFDFSGVRVHDDGPAAASAHDLRAKAYTVGRHVVFNSGQYAPQTPAGMRLLAHELTHVVQQAGRDRELAQRELDDSELTDDADIGESAPVIEDDDAADGDSPVVGSSPVFDADEDSLQLKRDEAQIVQRAGEETETKPIKPQRATIETIEVDQASQQMTVSYSDGTKETHAVSTGRGRPNTKGDPCKTQTELNCTPNGSFTVSSRKGGDTKNRDGDAMSWYVGFVDSRGIGIHDSQPVPGIPHSHGCVRVGSTPADDAFAKKINSRVVVGKTKVIVSGKAPTKPWTKAAPKQKPKSKPVKKGN